MSFKAYLICIPSKHKQVQLFLVFFLSSLYLKCVWEFDGYRLTFCPLTIYLGKSQVLRIMLDVFGYFGLQHIYKHSHTYQYNRHYNVLLLLSSLGFFERHVSGTRTQFFSDRD